jgi:hypothetical protein
MMIEYAKILASAAVAPSSNSNAELVLISAGVVLVVAIAGWVPIRLARVRGNKNIEVISAMLVLWGLILAGSISYSIMKQMDWTTTYQQQIQSGYFDPQNTADKPVAPMGLWCGLGIVYVGVIAWASRRTL